jgi:hypothetical protein
MDGRGQISSVAPSFWSAARSSNSRIRTSGPPSLKLWRPLLWAVHDPNCSRDEALAKSGSSSLPIFFALVSMALGQSAQGDNKPIAAATLSPYQIVSQIGEAAQQLTLKDGKLLAHRRTTDPFGVAIRGKFKGLPPVVAEQTPVGTSSPAASNKPAVSGELTLEKAVQQLPIGAVNVANREALIGYRAIHEGDLLVLELNGHQFVVWVQSIDRRGVQFCDITLQQKVLKPFRFGPNELPENSTGGQTEVRDFLKQDVH